MKELNGWRESVAATEIKMQLDIELWKETNVITS